MKGEKITFVFAFRYLVSPHADSGFAIVSQTRRALIPGRFTVPTVPEDVAFGLVGKDAVKTLAMRRGDWRLCSSKIQLTNCRFRCVPRLTQLRPVAAIDVVDVVAVLGEELGVAGVESQSVSARLQLRHVVVALVVLVAGRVMWVETEVVRTLEAILAVNCKQWNDC